jgi:molybdopterin/thiamine biosynthesis adenylyltransferase
MLDVTTAGVCVIGAGGLGCPALLALSAAGVMRLHIVDHDIVESHNLQRQVLYALADVGRRKIDAAAHRLRARVPEIAVHGIARRLDPDDADAFVAELPPHTVLCEGSDDPDLKFAINDAALRHGVPLVIGSALGWRGQALAVAPGCTCYRCIFEAPPPPDLRPTCAQAGVVGAGVGLVGHLMANLALGLLHDRSATAGRMFAIDLLHGAVRTLEPSLRAGCSACASAAAPSDPPRLDNVARPLH